MSPTWFIIKSLLMTFAIVSFLQIRIGKEAQTLELIFVSWMKNLSASKRIQDMANGGKELTTDVIREFTTPDGGKIFIREMPNSDVREKATDRSMVVQSGLVHRILEGFKLDISDLNSNAQITVKEQVKKELEAEMRKEYDGRLKKAGINPTTLELE